MSYHAKMIAGGKVVIPAELRRELGLKPGDTVVFDHEEDGTLTLKTYRQVVREIQEEMRTYIPEGASIVDEFIADRRAEAAREEEEAQRWLAEHGRTKRAS